MSSSPSPRFHWLRLRATAHPTEDPERVRRAVAQAAGIDDPAQVTGTRIETHHGAEMELLELELKRAPLIRACLQHVRHALPPEGEVDERTDDDGVFYFRLAKQAAFRGEVARAVDDDAIQVRLKAEVHPARREAAVQAVAHWLASLK